MFIAAKYEEMYAPEIGKFEIEMFSCNFCPQLFYNIFRRLCLHHWSRLFRIANSWNGNENLGRIRIRFGTSIAFTFSTQKFQSWQRRCPYSHPRQVCHGIDFGQLRNGPLGKYKKINLGQFHIIFHNSFKFSGTFQIGSCRPCIVIVCLGQGWEVSWRIVDSYFGELIYIFFKKINMYTKN